MDHNAYKEMLSALLDGELHGAERETALAHMEACADCRAYFAELTALRTVLGGLEEFDAPEDFAAGVIARIRAGNITGDVTARQHGDDASKTVKKRAKNGQKLRGYTALAACAAVVLLAVYALPNALRMGGNSVARDSAIQAAPAATAPAGASGAPDAPAAALDMAAPQDPAAPNPAENYVFAGNAGGMTLESASEEEDGVTAEGGVEGADRPAPASDRTANGGADNGVNGESYVTSVTKEPDERLSVGGTEETPMVPLSRPEAWGDGYPVLTLSGEGAESWLAENGWQGESGVWYADAAALRALPDGLTVLYSELPEDYDGAVLVELWEAEP